MARSQGRGASRFSFSDFLALLFVSAMSGIFISYRRSDGAPHAGRLNDRLCDYFGADKVFMDVDDIKPGADFVSLIGEKVASCDALIAVIGKGWLARDEDNGKPRLYDPTDFVRLELEHALQRDILLIPALVEGAEMPRGFPSGKLWNSPTRIFSAGSTRSLPCWRSFPHCASAVRKTARAEKVPTRQQ